MSKKRKNKEMQIAGFRGVGDRRGNELTSKEKAFIEAFIGPAEGDAIRAAHLAGYASGTIGLSKLAIKPIRNEIDRRLAVLDSIDAALTPLEIHALWRRLTKHPDPNIQLRASENAAKARGMFITKTESTVQVRRDDGIGALDKLLDDMSEQELEQFVEFVRIKKKREGLVIEAEVIDD